MTSELEKAQARHEQLVAELTERINVGMELDIERRTMENERLRKHLDRTKKYWWYRILNSSYGPISLIVFVFVIAFAISLFKIE